MLGTILYEPGDARCEEVAEPKILHPTDVIIRLSAVGNIPPAEYAMKSLLAKQTA